MTNIRPAEPQDVDKIFRLGSHVPEFSVNEKTVNFWPREILADAIASKDAAVLVAEAGGRIVGFIIANLNVSLRKAIIENVYVAPDKRRGGIGDELLANLLESLGRTSVEYISTLIPADAREAARLYEAAGFAKGEAFLWLDKSTTGTFKSG